ncbi:hypothetical protein RV11_GL000085 [Enterococcus phoeniculicola]|nr:hypothetical protein RV11_GL000085 [Enterococcus phoeniculicola]
MFFPFWTYVRFIVAQIHRRKKPTSTDMACLENKQENL